MKLKCGYVKTEKSTQKMIVFTDIFIFLLLPFGIIGQECQDLWTQCELYNNIALEAYKNCHNSLDTLKTIHEEIELNFNQTKLELGYCHNKISQFGTLVAIPWVLVGL